MHKTTRLTRELDDRRRLILARRMVTRTRAGAACAPCKAKKARCSDYRPCARCRNLRLDDYCQKEKHPQSPISLRIASHSSAQERTIFHEDQPRDNTFAGSIMISLIASDHAACQQWVPLTSAPLSWPALPSPIAAAPVIAIPPPQLSGQNSSGAFPHEPHQVTRPLTCPSASRFKNLRIETPARPSQWPNICVSYCTVPLPRFVSKNFDSIAPSHRLHPSA
jgi:hypothetical protein